MNAISVKYVRATKSRGTRLIASCYLGKITVSYDHCGNCLENMLVAAIELCKKYNYDYNKLNSAGVIDNYTSVFTFIDGTETLAHLRTRSAVKAALIAV
jgi:hypothetical protein